MSDPISDLDFKSWIGLHKVDHAQFQLRFQPGDELTYIFESVPAVLRKDYAEKHDYSYDHLDLQPIVNHTEIATIGNLSKNGVYRLPTVRVIPTLGEQLANHYWQPGKYGADQLENDRDADERGIRFEDYSNPGEFKSKLKHVKVYIDIPSKGKP